MAWLLLWLRWVRRFVGLTNEVYVVDNNGEGRLGSVACWPVRKLRYRQGETVPPLHQVSTYSVQTSSKWYANVNKGRLDGWTEKPLHDSTFDMYGRFIGGFRM